MTSEEIKEKYSMSEILERYGFKPNRGCREMAAIKEGGAVGKWQL